MQQTDLNVKAGAEASFEAFTGSASTHTEKQKKESIQQKIIIYSGRRLMGSLWDREKLIPITD